MTESHTRWARVRRLPALALIASGWGWACGAPPGQGADASHRVLLGTGSDGFQPIAEGAAVPLISGIQGGFHVWTSFLAFGFETDVVHMDLSTRIEGDPDSLVPMPGSVALRPTTDDLGKPVLGMWGWPAAIHEPGCAHDETLVLELRVEDFSGNVASDERRCIVFVEEQYRDTDCAP